MKLDFSFIIPVFNRPEEVRELLDSFVLQSYSKAYEIVIVEDGSTLSAAEVVSSYKEKLLITYLYKENSGPGDSRNYGMRHAKGSYFIILDSDCVLPPNYLTTVERSLEDYFVHCYGGPDAAHTSFSNVQKAINFAMTSFLTTGGIRGKASSINRFQPRSFNMGVSKIAFEKTKGFGNIHPGEDPDLTFRIWKAGFDTKLIPEAFVYHKRRIDFSTFFIQVRKFGMVRPILNIWHPGTAKLTYWFPTFFCLGFLVSLLLLFMGKLIPMLLFVLYFVVIFATSLFKTKNVRVAILSIKAVAIQFVGYGLGFLKSTIYLTFSDRKPQEVFPKLFFQNSPQGEH